MPHNPIPGLNEHEQANPNSGIQNTTHKGHKPGSNPDSTGRRELTETGLDRVGTEAHDPSAAYDDASAPSQTTRDPDGGAPVKGNTWVRPVDSDGPRHSQQSNPWYADDRIGLVVAGLVIAGVLVAAWAVHRDD